MKMVKSLLLGSAAGLVAVAGAQAADMPVKAKPVQYVKICSLYGEGFYYIPGTDTCIRVGGYVRTEYGWNLTAGRNVQYNVAAGGNNDITKDEYSTRHRGNITIDTRTQSQYGTVRTLISVHASNQGGADEVRPSRALIQFAGFTFGRTRSATDNDVEITDFYSWITAQGESDSAANGVNQISYTLDIGNGMTLTAGADERRVKALGNLSTSTLIRVGSDPTSSRAGQRWPDPYIAFKINQAWGNWGVAVVAHDNRTTYYTGTAGVAGSGCPAGAQTGTTQCGYAEKVGWAVLSGGSLKLPFIAAGDSIMYYFNYSQGASGFGGGTLSGASLFGSGNNVGWGPMTDGYFVNGAGLELTTAWTVAGAFEHFWSPILKTSLYGTYTEINHNATVKGWFASATTTCGGTGSAGQTGFAAANCNPDWKFWTVGSRTQWTPVKDLYFAVDVALSNVVTAFNGAGTINSGGTIGARPTGAYNFNNQNILAVGIRAQRNY